MPVETPSLFARVIQDHLDLKERNSRLEETMDGEEAAPAVEAHVPAWPGEETMEQQASELDSGLWSRSRDFDWGD